MVRTACTVLAVSLFVVACKPRDRSKDAPPAPVNPNALPLELNARASELCRRLEAAGAAKNCAEPIGTFKSGSLRVKFDPAKGAKGIETVEVFFADKYDDVGGLFPIVDPKAPAPTGDVDYPSLYVTSAPNSPPPGASGKWRITWGTDAWEKCRKSGGGGTVAACTKKYPAEYANAKALYEASRKIATGT